MRDCPLSTLYVLTAAGPTPALGRLSAELGFANPDAFRSKYGFAPSEARNNPLAGAVSFAGPDPDRPHMTIPGWVRAFSGA
jgi:hypothetical protein